MHGACAEIVRLLELETAAIRAFADELRDEQSALVRGDVERVAELAAPKSSRIGQLARVDESLHREFARLGLAASDAAIERLACADAAFGDRLRSTWAQLRDAAAGARRLNETNGTLITARLATTRRALTVLLAASGTLESYGADGATLPLRPAQRLAVV